MYYPTIDELQSFYESKLGQFAYKNIDNSLNQIWPSSTNEIIIGIGYSNLYLNKFLLKNNLCSSIIPSSFIKEQNLSNLKLDCLNSSIISKFNDLPIASSSADKILLIHLFEYTNQQNSLLREIWRVLKPGGKLLIVVPNKFSIWPIFCKIQFKKSKFFTIMQLHNILTESMLIPVKTSSTLFSLSEFNKFIPELSNIFENWSSKWLLPFGGMILMEAEKLTCSTTHSEQIIKSKKVILSTSQAS
jgi:SAM-dependent methyltransferase